MRTSEKQGRQANVWTGRTSKTLTALLFAAALQTAPASAVVYVMPTDESMVDRSPIIVFGEVLGAQPGPDGRSPTTDYLFAVEEVLKGFVAGSGIMVRQPGGVAADGTAMRVMGLPMLAEGERVLLFLQPEESGAHSIVEYALGMFWEVDVGGRPQLVREPSLQTRPAIHSAVSGVEETALRTLPRDAQRFRRWITDRAASVERAADYFGPEPLEGPVATRSPYRLIRTPDACLHDLLPLRWQDFDLGKSVRMTVHSGGQVGVRDGGGAELRAAMRAWNNDAESHVRLATAGPASPTRENTRPDSGHHWILFEDPFDQIAGEFDPRRGGTLAVTYTSFSCGGTVRPHNTLGDPPVQALQITATLLITQNGYGEGYLAPSESPEENHEEIMAHELGHVLGISHSCGFDLYPCPDNGAIPEAIMRAYGHGDGRGARLNSDDLAALRYLYPLRSDDSPGPDLVVGSPRSTEGSVAPGGAFRFGATVRNEGDGPSEATTLRYYRSADSTITTSDRPVGTDPIGALSASDADRQSIGQRAPSSDGTYYYGACVDPVVGETDTTNNCSSGVRVTVGDGGEEGEVGSGFALDRANDYPKGITYADGRFYVVDYTDDKVYAYRASDGLHDPTADFDLDSENGRPGGITHAQDRFYVVDWDDRKVYAYHAPDGRRDAAADFDLASEHDQPEGIAYAQDRFYIVAYYEDKVYAYRASDGRHDPTADFDLYGENNPPDGITHARDRFYVVDDTSHKVYAYRAWDGSPDPTAHFDLDGENRHVSGITYAGGKFFVVDELDDSVYAYLVGAHSPPTAPPAADLVVESPRSTARSVAPRGKFRFGATVRNQGEGPSDATTLRYYRSTDNMITTSDTPVGTDSIAALSVSDTDRQSIGQRAPASAGTYYYGACVDAVSGEGNRRNNCSNGVRLTVGDGDGDD